MPSAAFCLCFGLWFPWGRRPRALPLSPVTSVAWSHKKAGLSLSYHHGSRDTAGWYPLDFQRGVRLGSPCSLGLPLSPHSTFPYSVAQGLVSSSQSLCFYLSLTIHITPFEEKQRKCMHRVALSPSLSRICGFSNRDAKSIPQNAVGQSLLPYEPLRSPHGGLAGCAFTGSSLQSYPGAISPWLPGTTVPGSLISSTHKCLEKSLYFWKPQR